MKRRFIPIVVLLPLLFLYSCNQWLDVKPSSEMEREDLYNTADGFKTSLAGCYIKMQQSMLYGQSMTMTIVEYLAQHWVTESEELGTLLDFDWKSDHAKSVTGAIWSNMYGMINHLNDLLIQLDKKGDKVLPEKEMRYLVKGEALALRAFCHFDILRLFGPSPISPDKSSLTLPYSEISGKDERPYYSYDVYCEKIWTDLREAERLLGEVDPVLQYTFTELNDPGTMLKSGKLMDDFQSYRRIRFNYWAVKAFEARVALYLGDKEAAYKYATEVIDARVQGKPVGDLSAANSDFSKGYYTLPSETLFALNSYDLQDEIQVLFRESRTVLYKWENTQEVLINLFDSQSADVRVQLWTQMDYDDQRHAGLKKYWQGDEEKDAEVPVMGQQIPLLRMAEMYLIAAETAPALAEGNEKLKQFRNNRNLTLKECSSVEELKNEVLKEYQKEFYAEGQMYFTYKRIGARKMLWNEEREIRLDEYQIPLPETEFTY